MTHIFNSTPHNIMISNITRADGIYLYDDNENRYMDLESGVWCTALGHANKQINSAIKQQIDTIMHAGYCYSSDIVEEAAGSILSITGFKNGRCVFLCSGSEAIELARQTSKHITGKRVSMTFHDSYLGSYSSVVNRETDWFIFDWTDCRQCIKKDACDSNCKKLKTIPDNISEFIFEPGSSSGFVRFPPKALIQNIVRAVRTSGGKIIANEVTTGIGRTGKWFGYHHYGIEPDLVAIGKGIGNGYPVSATAMNERTANELKNGTFKYMQSHQNDPLGAAIVNQVIRIIQEKDLIKKAEANGIKFLKMLNTLQENHQITDVRGRGLMFALDLCDKKTCDRIFEKLISSGFIVCNRKLLFRIDPPLIIEENEFEEFVRALKRILESDQPGE